MKYSSKKYLGQHILIFETEKCLHHFKQFHHKPESVYYTKDSVQIQIAGDGNMTSLQRLHMIFNKILPQTSVAYLLITRDWLRVLKSLKPSDGHYML